MYKTKVYAELAALLQAVDNCRQSAKQANTAELREHWLEMKSQHRDKIHAICENVLPHGSGFDSGCKLDMDRSTPDHLIILAPFHHMDENGMYCGWIDYTVHVTPSLHFGFELRIHAHRHDRVPYGQIEYMHEKFSYVLSRMIDIQTLEVSDDIRTG